MNETRHVLDDYRILGFGYLYLRGDWIWLRYSARGKEYRKPARTKNPKRAFQQLRTLHGKAQTGASVDPKIERVLVGALLDALEAHFRLGGVHGMKAVLSHLKPIREAFADSRAIDLTAEAVDLLHRGAPRHTREAARHREPGDSTPRAGLPSRAPEKAHHHGSPLDSASFGDRQPADRVRGPWRF